MIGYLLLSIIPIFAFCYYVLPKIIPWSDAQRDLFAWLAWRDETAARGLSFTDAIEELRLREHLAKVRRIASAEVLLQPARADEIMRATIAREIRSVANVDKARAKVFAKASKTWLPYDLLHSDAHAAWLKAAHVPTRKPTREEREDMLSAMRLT